MFWVLGLSVMNEGENREEEWKQGGGMYVSMGLGHEGKANTFS